MTKAFCLLVCLLLLAACAEAETEISLPGSRYLLDIPEEMQYSAPGEGDQGIHAWFSDSLEMDYACYPWSALFQPGEEQTLMTLAQLRTDGGFDVEIRDVRGIEMLVFRVTDETDGTPGIGYLFRDGNWAAEIYFWYATQEAADLTETIILSIHEGQPSSP